MQKNHFSCNTIESVIQLNPNIYLDWKSIEKRKKQFQTMHPILLTHKLNRYCNQGFIYLKKKNMTNKLIDLSFQPRMILLSKICNEIDYNLEIIKNIYKLNGKSKEKSKGKSKEKSKDKSKDKIKSYNTNNYVNLNADDIIIV